MLAEKMRFVPASGLNKTHRHAMISRHEKGRPVSDNEPPKIRSGPAARARRRSPVVSQHHRSLTLNLRRFSAQCLRAPSWCTKPEGRSSWA